MVMLEDGDGGVMGAEVEDAIEHTIFIGFFVGIFSPATVPAVKDQTAGIIAKAQKEMKMLNFKPSVAAVAALLVAVVEVIPGQLTGFHATVDASGFVDTTKLCEYCNVMGELIPANDCDPSPEALSSCRTPVTILTGHNTTLLEFSQCNTLPLPLITSHSTKEVLMSSAPDLCHLWRLQVSLLKMTGCALHQRYVKQFRRIVNVISIKFLTVLKEREPNAPKL